MTFNKDSNISLMVIMTLYVVVFFIIIVSPAIAVQSSEQSGQMVDDFESYQEGGLPDRWGVFQNKKLKPVEARHMKPDEKFFVAEDGGNKVLRVYSEGEAVHIMMENSGDFLDWNIKEMPRLAWDWRALQLPERAREDVEKLNDSGAALYVIFKMEGFLIKRPKTIKYVYSSSLPVGTVVSYGKLKVIVAASGLDGIGEWIQITRNVSDDYKDVFGDNPPRRPLSIRLWSDSDNTESPAEVDFDNIRILPKG